MLPMASTLLLLLVLTVELASAWTPIATRFNLGHHPSSAVRRGVLSSACASYRPLRTKVRMKSLQPEETGEIQALLFDCDGTLVDSMPMWANNWVETCAEFSIDLDEEGFFELAGLTIQDTLAHLCTEQGKTVDSAEFFRRKDELACDSVKLVTEIFPVAQAARDAHGVYKMAVVSSGPRAMVEQFLQQTELRQLFEVMVCAEDVVNHKPHPEPFLLAAQRLGVSPEACRAYEDADAGCESVRGAGMQLVDVRLLEGYPTKKSVTSSGQN